MDQNWIYIPLWFADCPRRTISGDKPPTTQMQIPIIAPIPQQNVRTYARQPTIPIRQQTQPIVPIPEQSMETYTRQLTTPIPRQTYMRQPTGMNYPKQTTVPTPQQSYAKQAGIPIIQTTGVNYPRQPAVPIPQQTATTYQNQMPTIIAKVPVSATFEKYETTQMEQSTDEFAKLANEKRYDKSHDKIYKSELLRYCNMG